MKSQGVFGRTQWERHLGDIYRSDHILQVGQVECRPCSADVNLLRILRHRIIRRRLSCAPQRRLRLSRVAQEWRWRVERRGICVPGDKRTCRRYLHGRKRVRRVWTCGACGPEMPPGVNRYRRQRARQRGRHKFRFPDEYCSGCSHSYPIPVPNPAASIPRD